MSLLSRIDAAALLRCLLTISIISFASGNMNGGPAARGGPRNPNSRFDPTTYGQNIGPNGPAPPGSSSSSSSSLGDSVAVSKLRTIAPSTIVTVKDGGVYYKVEIGPAGWACTELLTATPDKAYGTIKSYLEAGNTEKVMLPLDTFPVIEKLSTDDDPGELCVYLDKEHQCYPPISTVDSGKVYGLNEHFKKPYYSRLFWGQSSDSRVKKERSTLEEELKDSDIKFDGDFYYVLHWPDQMKEVRYDAIVADF